MQTTSTTVPNTAAATRGGPRAISAADAGPDADRHAPRNAADERLIASDVGSLQRVVRAVLRRALIERAAGEVPTLGTIRLDLPQADGTRIRLAVTQTAAGAGIAAVCAPAHRPRVERCLAQMRAKLALAGISLHCKVHER